MIRAFRWQPLCACLWLLGLSVPAARAEPVVTLMNNGDSANRIDVAILGDGYTAAEMSLYALDALQLVQKFFDEVPFRNYRRFFNVHRVDVVSSQSGADHPERRPAVVRDTALDAAYNCFQIQRLICISEPKVAAVLQRSLAPTRRDLVLILVNDREYGGSGGKYSVASTHADAVEVALHEVGHTLGLLADEYGGDSGPSCDTSTEPREVNATKESRRDLVKWRHWLVPGTPLPSGDSRDGVPGLYEGSRYCDKGLYRPTFNSKMRSLERPFEAINSEQLVKRFYNFVAPIDASEPTASTLTLAAGATQRFRVAIPEPSLHALTVEWRVDGQARGTGIEFLLSAVLLNAGTHTLEAVIRDPTPLVRNDSSFALAQIRQWRVTIAGP